MALLCAPLAPAAASPAAASLHVLIINGGDRPESNYASHLQHVQGMVDLLLARGLPPQRIHVFSADGEDPLPDLASRDAAPDQFWLIADTPLGNLLKTQTGLIDGRVRGVRVSPARLEALRTWFDTTGRTVSPGDRVLLFVTDHGNRGNANDPGSGTISLWKERLSARELRALLDRLAPGVQVTAVMSQCYSGAFADLMFDRPGPEPSGNTCGFFSTSASLQAYGCYPEERARDGVGHALEFIEALGTHGSTAQAHAEVLLSDDTPDRPRATSDEYLARLVSAEASARRQQPEAFADTLLDRAWRRGAGAWEAEIRQLDAIGDVFGSFSPRSFAELRSRDEDLAALATRLKTYAAPWSAAMASAKAALLRRFTEAHPDWRPRLDQKTVEGLPPEDRASLLAALLGELGPFAGQQADLWPRLERCRDTVARVAEASRRFEVRKAVADRMRTILFDVAGRELLEASAQTGASDARRSALDRLLRCEDLQLDALPGSGPPASSRPSFPSLDQELALVDELQPSWLGIGAVAVTPAIRKARPALAKGALVETVEDGSPAAEAGFQRGDIVVGPPDQPFTSSQDLREWAMLAARDVALPLRVFRPGTNGDDDREFDAMVYLRPFPGERPESGMPKPVPRPGAGAPPLPEALESGRDDPLPDLRGRAHVLFFWATWCGPCKAAVPEVLAFASSKGLPVLAITDEPRATVDAFLKGWTQPFFESVAIDRARKSFVAHGISGTPTTVVVDDSGIVAFRQVGYLRRDGLKAEGWRWGGR